ncbi:hypothetical protein SDC9_146358 [bioreactor metagenome]|uniref:Uncharacterized protein n=1 Tax=bioreactor metagenome TaxID=1076179 RepID=A0A645EB08_9ZZZZ
MTVQFHRFFSTHTIYVTLDDGNAYKLNPKDLSREMIDQIPNNTKESPIMVLHKKQFDMAKDYLMNIDSPFRILVDEAEDYKDIGFISEKEFIEYKNKIQDIN